MKRLTFEEALGRKKATDERARAKYLAKPRKPPKRLKRPLRAIKKPKKQSGTSKLKAELDKVFSRYIRAKYPMVCYTCGKQSIALRCGHFVSRQYLATRWSELNCRPQCWGCNAKHLGNGKPLDFEERLKGEYGDMVIEELKSSRRQIIKLSIPWYKQEIESYKQRIVALDCF